MAIQRVEDKNKLLSKVELHPKRTYISGSWGVSGSIYVFPNRSETQKDNIDERLDLFPLEDATDPEWDGTMPSADDIIRPFSGDSLEARRIEIYAGNFNKYDQTLVDAIAWEYTFRDVSNVVTNFVNGGGTVPFDHLGSDTFFGDDMNDWLAEDPSRLGVGDQVDQINPYDGQVTQTFSYTSNNRWTSDKNNNIYNHLPINDRDFGSLNYEVPLGLLLDGADAMTRDHAWRARSAYEAEQGTPNYSLGNSSLTGGNPELFQFTGWNYEMMNGFPQQTTTITTKQEVNAWPPEIDKWGSNIITTFAEKGYSDLGMHPRNKTKKEIQFERANHDYFSKGSIKQRNLYRSVRNKGLLDEGWWSYNNFCLNLSSWTDSAGTIRKPALVYPNRNEQYEIDYSDAGVGFTFEFWIKPDSLQTNPGCICQLRNNYALMLIPDTSSFVDSKPTRFSISLRTGTAAADGESIVGDTDFRDDPSNPSWIFVSRASLLADEWSHVAIRWGRNFNNGQMTMYLNNVVLEEFDGIYDGTREGLIDIRNPQGFQTGNSENYGLFLGGYPSTTGTEQRGIWDEYSENQRGITWSTASVTSTPDANTGLLTNFGVNHQLISELTEFKCWNYPRSEYEIGQTWKQRSSSVESLLIYVPFYFDPDHENYEKKFKLTPGSVEGQSFEPQTNLKDVYYGSSSSISDPISNTDRQKTPYCQNWGHVGGAPFVNIGSHTKEYVNSEIAVILDMPNFALKTKEVYYNFDVSDGEVQITQEKVKYIIDKWHLLPWLTCWNSLIAPSTADLQLFTSEIVDKTSQFAASSQTTGPMIVDYDIIENIDLGTDSGQYEDGLASAMFEDERWMNGDRTEQRETITLPNGTEFDGDTVAWQIEPNISGEGINSLLSIVEDNGLYRQDFLTPFAPVISIPILYYGNRIDPTTFFMKTTVSGKEVKIVDLNGVLYIADKNNEPTVAKVGHIDYEFGYLCIFSHLMSSITLEETLIEFRGDKNLHVLQFDVRCPPGLGNESKNSNYKSLRPSPNANESDSVVTYVSTIYLHDENLNVIGKVKLAQPIQKREEDSFLFRIKMDF